MAVATQSAPKSVMANIQPEEIILSMFTCTVRCKPGHLNDNTDSLVGAHLNKWATVRYIQRVLGRIMK